MNARRYSCEGKERLTRTLAQRIARRQRRMKGAASNAYKCPVCGHYHVGSKKKNWRAP